MVDRWLHIVAGVMWIGLLYYFNVVQVPALADAAADKGGPGGAGITKYIAPRALWWFRWAAVVTWVTGAYYLLFGYGAEGALHKAFAFQPGFVTIGVGAWLGTIMLFNVWADLAEPEEDTRPQACDRRRKGEGTQDCAVCVAHEFHPVRADAHVHGRPEPRPAVLTCNADSLPYTKPGHGRVSYFRALDIA